MNGIKKNLPDFLIIGVQRAGTTWLYTQLKKHPDICMGKHRKEISYFDKYYDRGEQWYKAFFEQCEKEKIIGEVSPNYIYDTNCAERIYKLVPEVKLIIVLRNPINRAYSQYKKKVVDFGNKKSFMENLKNMRKIPERGLYYKQIKRYLKYFSRNNIRFLIFEEMTNNPEENLRKVFGFLGVNPSFLPDGYQKNVNPSEMPRFHRLYIFFKKVGERLHEYNLSWAVKVWKNLRLNEILFLKKGQDKSFNTIPEEAYEYLKNYYKEDIKKLSKLIGRDMRKFWKI